MFDLKSPLFGFWLVSLVVPLGLLSYLLYLAFCARARLYAALAFFSCLFALFVGVLYPLSRSADCYVQLSWNKPRPDGTVHHWFFTGDSIHGGVGICLRGSATRPAALDLAQIGRDPDSGWSPFPTAESKYALVHSDFLEKHGFQICVNSYLPGDHNFTLYALSLPRWFLFLLTPWFPLAWYFRRRAAGRAPGFPIVLNSHPFTRLSRLLLRPFRAKAVPQTLYRACAKANIPLSRSDSENATVGLWRPPE